MSMAGYTKLFNSILASTIWRASDKTRIVWITMLAMADKDGVVEGSVPGLADFARVNLSDCQAALAELLAPDEYSRSSENDGRRIEALDGVGWRLLNHSKYRAKMSEDERREYNRIKQSEWRARNKQSANVNDSQLQSAMSAHTEAEAYTKEEKREVDKPPSTTKKFSKPTIPEIRAYCTEISSPIDPSTFFNHYEMIGWKVGRGRTPMVDWHAAIRGWTSRENK